MEFKSLTKMLPSSIKKKLNKGSSPSLIFLGNPKSGTTVISNLVAIASHKTISYDMTYKAFFTDWQYLLTKILQKAGLRKNLYNYSYGIALFNKTISFSEFYNRKRLMFSSDILKDPFFTFIYQDVVKIFTEAKFVYIVRNPFDNIRSILNRLKIEGNLDNHSQIYQHKLDQIKVKLPSWGGVLEGTYPPLSGKNYIENLSLRWNLGVETYLQNSDDMILVRYEDFLADKINCIYQLCHQLNLPVVNDISNHINKQYQPKGKSDLDIHEFFGDENYHTIDKICGKNASYFRY